MKIVVSGSELAMEELIKGKENIEWIKEPDVNSFVNYTDADAFFNLSEFAFSDTYANVQAPVFINSVHQCRHLNKKVIRINGWCGFLEKTTWEICGIINAEAAAVLAALNKTFIETADEPGFISPRTIAMIINEAFLALEEKVSTTEEIDIAMKLGTNYPYGPFEWSEKIGLKNIYSLLGELSLTDKRYHPASSIKNKFNA
jgi:3-hydroxybutyryl-CoA dehydrogenase